MAKATAHKQPITENSRAQTATDIVRNLESTTTPGAGMELPIRVPEGGDMTHPAIAGTGTDAGLMVEGRATQRTTSEVDAEVKAINEELLSDAAKGLTTKSAKMRYLSDKGHSRSAIAKALGVRYQHVRNVLIAPLKRSDGMSSSSTDAVPTQLVKRTPNAENEGEPEGAIKETA